MAASVEYLFCQFEPSCICFFGSVVLLFLFFLSSIFFVFSWDAADCSFFFIFSLMISGMFLCTRLFECELLVSVWFSIYLFFLISSCHHYFSCWGSASRFCPANIARFEAEVVCEGYPLFTRFGIGGLYESSCSDTCLMIFPLPPPFFFLHVYD